MDVPVIDTDRLLMREWREADFDAYASWVGDEETARFIGGKPLDRADAWRSLAMMTGHWQLRGYGMWAVEEKASGVVVGRVGLWFPEGWPGIECGWLIGKEHRRKGYAKEAAHASLRWGFTTLRIERIISIIHVDNAPSAATAKSLGQTFVEHQEIRGSPCAIWAIDSRDLSAID